MRSIDPEALGARKQYALLAGSVVPRPIALVTTCGPSGPNAAPFSFFNVLGVDPPMLLFSVGMRDGAEKDTVRNLRSCPELVIHLVDEANAEQMNRCAMPFGPTVNELEEVGFKTLPSDLVRPPRIASCPVHFECALESIVPFGKVPYHLVISRVLRMHFRDDVVDDDMHVNLLALAPIARVTGPGVYARIRDTFRLQPMG
jgi:flavin reductase (DIM6/NTAB) family NADH-FMN oxidoreductase RutF